MRKRWTVAILMLLAGFLLLDRPGLIQQAIQTGDPESLPADVLDFDSYASGVNTILFTANGDIDYTLQAASQIHYMSGITLLTEPFIRLHQTAGERWNILASSGRIQSRNDSQAGSDLNIETLELIDDVEIYQLDDRDNRMRLTTSFLSVDPQSETLVTDAMVRLEGAGLDQTAQGMHVDLSDNTIRFNSQVRGRYDPGQ